MDITIIGAGAIGGTIGAHMARAGHGVLLCDADTDHVAAINADGLHIEGPVEDFTVRVDAVTPEELPDRVGRGGVGAAVIAVKSLHTASAAQLVSEVLAPDGYVLTTQNGLTADTLSGVIGAERVVSSFINVGADYLEPGRILQGNIAAFRIGELAGGAITPRVGLLADAMPYALPTENVLGYLWGKEAYGAMLWAGAVSDLTIADSLSLPAYRDLMIAVAQEAIDQAPVQVESFDGFVPDDLPGSLDRLAGFNRRSAKARSGIWRDLMVRKRKTEVDEVHKDIQGPVFDRIVAMVHDIEEGRRTCETANLDELAAFVRELPTSVPLTAGH